VSSPAPLLPDWLRAELAPTAGRWRQALAATAASTVALGVTLALQFGSFPAPVIGLKGLLPGIVCTWPLLGVRLGAIVAGASGAVLIGGLVVQLPWLLVPAFFATMTALMYLVPIRQNPIAGYCVALTVSAVVYSGVFVPQAIGTTGLSLGAGFAIGIVVATLFARLRATPSSVEQLADALAAAFAGSGAVLRDAAVRIRAGVPAPLDAGPPLSAMTRHLQLLSLVRMEALDLELERACVALITAAERAATYVSTVDRISRRPLAAPLRELLGDEIEALFAALVLGLAAFARAARQPAAVISAAAPVLPADWPDYLALVDALHARQRALIGAGRLRGLSLDDSTALHALAQALGGLADVLHLPPDALEHTPVTPGPQAPRRLLLPPFDRYAAQFAAKIGLACTLALIVGVASHQPAMETVVLNPLILAQGSYGATIRQTWLRCAGVVAGGAVAVLTMIAVMPNTGDVGVWLMVYFAVLLPCVYVALGTPRLSYLGLQTAITFMIVIVADGPTVDVGDALWRFFGTVVGAALLFGVFAVVAPDYAGRQIVSRLSDLLRLLLSMGPEPGRPLAAVARLRVVNDQVTAGLADLLRLAGEAEYEGAATGVRAVAVVEAAGILRRITHRYGLMRHGRRAAPYPPRSAALATARDELETALRRRLARLAEIVAARHHRARIDSRRHRRACDAARRLAAAPPPDLQPLLAAYLAGIEALRSAGFSGWDPEMIESLMAEVGHLRRIAELTPKLEAALLDLLKIDAPPPAAVLPPAVRAAAVR